MAIPISLNKNKEKRINNKNKEIKINNKSVGGATAPLARFTPPSLDEINNFCIEENINNINSMYFIDYYNGSSINK